MNKLGKHNFGLIEAAVRIEGTFDPEEISCLFLESLYVDEVDTVLDFLKWCHENQRVFGSRNYEEVFSEYKKI